MGSATCICSLPNPPSFGLLSVVAGRDCRRLCDSLNRFLWHHVSEESFVVHLSGTQTASPLSPGQESLTDLSLGDPPHGRQWPSF